MKKIFYTAGILATLSLTLFTSCKKDKEVFPTKSQENGNYTEFSYSTPYFPTISDADGILIAVQVSDEKTVVVSPFVNMYEYGMAKFPASTGNFSSLVDAGTVSVNDSNLVKSSDNSYLSSATTFSLNFGNTVAWNVTGNGANPAMSNTLTGSNPSYTYAINNWDSKWIPIYPRTLYAVPSRPAYTHLNSTSTHADTLAHNADITDITTFLTDSTTHTKDSVYNATVQYSIPISRYTSNADTVYVVIRDGSGFSYVRKMVPTLASDSVANFKPNDFAGYASFDQTTLNLQVNAIKYSSTMVGTRKYYYLKMNANIKYYGATK